MEQKCLIASAGMHGLLILLLVVGSAFFVPKEKPPPPPLPPLNMVPDFLVDDALAGGGGNPTLKPSDAKVKGETLLKPPPPPQTQEKESKPVEPKPDRAVKPKESQPDKLVLKEVPRTSKTSPTSLPDWLRPVSDAERKRVAEEETAKQRAAAVAANRRAIGETRDGLKAVKRGFADGTVVQAYGPGGAAYANYSVWVKAVYDDAWRVNDLIDESSTCVARVTIASNGDVLSARILTPSGNTALDRSVQRALNAVRTIGHPFPEGATEKERTFTINFNLKSKRGLG